MDDDVESILHALTRLIVQQLNAAASCQYFPTHDADNDDARIAQGKRRADELRELRHRFEIIVTGVIL